VRLETDFRESNRISASDLLAFVLLALRGQGQFGSPKWQNADKSSTCIARQVGRICKKDWRQDTQSEFSARSFQPVDPFWPRPAPGDCCACAAGGELNREASEATIECF
jgi:hypothetical protein